MNYRTAICDDSDADREYILKFLKKWADERGHTVPTKIYSSAESFLMELEDYKSYDILLLDIEMREMNGVELAKKIRSQNREVQIIFISGYDDYISEGYDVEALNYILKPVKYEKFSAVMDKAASKLEKLGKMITLNTPDGIFRIPIFDILYMEVRSNYVTVHTENEEIMVKTTLSKIEEELDDCFFRTGRSFIINLNHVYRTSRNEVILSDGSKVPLSRGMYEKLNQTFIRLF